MKFDGMQTISKLFEKKQPKKSSLNKFDNRCMTE